MRGIRRTNLHILGTQNTLLRLVPFYRMERSTVFNQQNSTHPTDHSHKPFSLSRVHTQTTISVWHVLFEANQTYSAKPNVAECSELLLIRVWPLLQAATNQHYENKESGRIFCVAASSGVWECNYWLDQMWYGGRCWT